MKTMTDAAAHTPAPNEDFCRKLCEEFDLMFADGIRPHPSAMSAISKAIQIVMEKAARIAEERADNCCDDYTESSLYVVVNDIRSLQLSAEDVRTEGIK